MGKINYLKQKSWSRLYCQLAFLTPVSFIFLNPAVAHPLYNAKNKVIVFADRQAQQTISGKITDAEGKAISGVTVKEKGGKNSTSTDADGKYILHVTSPNSILVISSIGYITQELSASNASTITLRATEDMLDEVVVVGYGNQKKTNLTSAVSQIDAKTLQNRPAPTVVNMLQGAAPGLVISRQSGRPGAQGLDIQVRGATSANGSVSPLIVIDGVISSEGTFTALNPNDIESISVLKDGGATAIYGAQSAGGVLLVTTKKGEKGKSRISLISNMAWQRPANIPERMSLIDEMKYVNVARANAGIAPEYNDEDLNYAVNGPTFVLGSNGQWRTYNQESLIDQVVKKTYNLYNHNLQFSGGSDNITYLASLGNMTQQGMFKVGEDHFERWNARINLSAQVNKYLKLDFGSTFINQATDNPQDGGYGIDGGGNGILRQFFSSRMRFPIYNEDGTYYRSGTSSAFGYALLKDGGFNRDRSNTYFNTATATINNFVKGLSAKLMYSREDITNQNRNFRRTVTYYSGPTLNTASQLNNPNNYSITDYKTLSQNYQAIVDYDFKLASDHNFHVMGGYQFYSYDYQYITASTKNLYVNDNPSLNFTSDPVNKSNNQYAAREKMQSYFGRFNYNYKEKYLFEATVRSDESSRLSAGDRVKVFPSFSAGWNMSKETWFDGISNVVNELKPRISWGKVGSKQGIGYYDYIAQLLTKTDVVLGDARQTYLYQDMLLAKGLSWETVETQNFGLDFSLLNRKLKGSFDYYNKYNKNMLVEVSLPETLGIRVPKSNEGKLKTWGWEAALAYNDKIGTDFTYGVSFNLADNQNRLVKYGGANDIVYSGVNDKVEGYALNSIWAYKTDGYFQNEDDLKNAPSYAKLLNKTGVPGLGDIRYIDTDGDGVISAGENRIGNKGDLVYLGDINPRYQYGFNVNLGYKNFDFSMFIQGIGKRKFKPSNELIQPQLYSYYLPVSFHADYWTPENPNAAFPRPYLEGNQNFQNSDKWFLNGAYARLKNIQIGYSLTKEKMPKLPFSRLRLYASGEDLLTFSNMGVFKGVIDPEMKTTDKYDSTRTISNPYPFTTSISFGLNIDF
ncbi:TonB-dependent receptor [Sphingobacterium sp. SRCM116780]|uniref:SusC/RagA family TonB-linked outer membrane protein n=1 Tax=Sphingobacterium sp. SRCM116780 TaxID=2907623 RepID=UPI001F1F3E52|nr:TonB-dependent receptor [Sphingobacterium sp. SRCM116780]UIR55986.1 TonB-dependent receptor [Sphingobacterium sp. SRCM116780]